MKNYFLIFFSTYCIILITKFIFIFYLQNQFVEFTLTELMYGVFWGYKFDFAASAIVSFLISLFDFNKKIFSILGSFLLVLVFLTQIGDILYFDEASRHVGYEITDIITDANSLLMTALSQHTLLISCSLILSLIFLIIFYKILSKSMLLAKIDKYFILKKLPIILISIFFIRGMFQHIPLHPWQSNEIGNTQLASISLNSIYNISYTLANQSKKLKPIKLPKLKESIEKKELYKIYKENATLVKTPIISSKPNIILFFLESWSAKYVSAYGYPKKTTPNYDEILQKSIRPQIMVANGHRTTEGAFATLTSFQNPLGKTIAKTQLQNYKYNSIIYSLNKMGYQSAFFQGTSKDTSGTGSLLSYLGFNESYGKRDIKKRVYEENSWGVQDGDLYNFITKKLFTKQIKEPFVIGINNASTHDIKIPKGEKVYNFSENDKLNKKLNTFHYSDKELGKFIKKVEKKYPNTIFLIFADHCGGSVKGNLNNYLIPFLIYSKKYIKPKYYDKLMSQRDIAPTLYDLIIGKNKNDIKNFTGKSLFRKGKNYIDYFHNGILGWIEDNNIIELNIANNNINCFTFNNLKKDKIACSVINSKELANRALSFTKISQKLLFEGKTEDFYKYKKP